MRPISGKRVFVCRDTVLQSVLDPVAEQLAGRGVTVTRGEFNAIGERKVYTAEESAQLVKRADVAVMTIRHVCSREFLDRAPALRAVCYPTIGVESADIPAATEKCIAIAHGATSGNVVGLAEATLMLTLNLLYDLRDSERRLRVGQPKPAYPRATALQGKTVGLIGFGRIARAVAHRLESFDVRMLAYAPRMRREQLPDGVTKADLETLLAASDIVLVLASLTPDSRGMLGQREFAKMKPGAYLVNTARGELIDEAALYETLAARRIAGAALDTFAQEPLPSSSPLRQLDNVILTPHMVGQTREAHDEFAPTLLENIERILRGQLPVHLKNTDVAERWSARWG